MTMKRTLILRIAGWLVLLIPLVGITSEPLPEPWYEFSFVGRLERSGGGPLQGYPVVVVQDSSIAPYWGTLRSCATRWPLQQPAEDISLTTDEGYFSLHVVLCSPPHDTLAVAVVLPDTIIVGSRIDRRQIHYSEYQQYYSYTEEKSFCGDKMVEGDYLAGYSYRRVDSLVVTIP